MEYNILNTYKQNALSDILPIVSIAENHSMNIVEHLGLLFKCILSLVIFMDLKCPIFIFYENLIWSNKKPWDISLTEHKQYIKPTEPHAHTHAHTHTHTHAQSSIILAPSKILSLSLRLALMDMQV